MRYIDLADLTAKAGAVMGWEPVRLTDHRAALSKGGPNDYYSNGDYWWPDPASADGLPYICRDGESNPNNFNYHRQALRRMRYAVTHLAAAYKITGDAKYADRAARWLKEFFLDPDTRMNPHLLYAQAIPGICDGRGIGIIDTLHLIDVPAAAEAVQGHMEAGEPQALRQWFADYLRWMDTHPYGIGERDYHNNHGITWWAQAASFARFTGDGAMLARCRERFKTSLIPDQMAPDGSFPLELKRTKPYCYSMFTLDNLCNIALLASADGDDLWRFALPDGRGIRLGLDFLLPYLRDKSAWPLPPDVAHDGELPVAMPFLLFAGLRYGDADCLDLWQTLEKHPASEELRRNIAVRCPYLLLDL